MTDAISLALENAFIFPYSWYEVSGNRLWPLYGGSGRLSAILTAVLVESLPHGGRDFGCPLLAANVPMPIPFELPRPPIEADGGRWIVVDFYAMDSYDEAMGKINQALLLLKEKGA